MAKRKSQFGIVLREQLESRGMSIRELARQMGGEKSESVRRNLLRWTAGDNVPDQRSRDAVADALGVSRSVFTEEAEREAQREQLADVLEDLADALLRVVKERIAETRESERVA